MVRPPSQLRPHSAASSRPPLASSSSASDAPYSDRRTTPLTDATHSPRAPETRIPIRVLRSPWTQRHPGHRIHTGLGPSHRRPTLTRRSGRIPTRSSTSHQRRTGHDPATRWAVSVAARMDAHLKKTITATPDDVWETIENTNAIYDENNHGGSLRQRPDLSPRRYKSAHPPRFM